jgi:hypothetical protein
MGMRILYWLACFLLDAVLIGIVFAALLHRDFDIALLVSLFEAIALATTIQTLRGKLRGRVPLFRD